MLKSLYYLKYLSIIGVIGFIINNTIMSSFIVFILIIVIEFKQKKKKTPFYFQIIKQRIGNNFLNIRYKNKDYYTLNNYYLPFNDIWFVENGGLKQSNSHSWLLRSQRYAFDFEKRDDLNRNYNGNMYNLNSYYCYKSDVLACLDGIVVKIVNKYNDNEILSDKSIYCTVDEIRGNYIIIKHDNNEYSLVAHLLKDSICVVENECVIAKQVIAKCGNSGNSSGPHIHFQVTNSKSFYFGLSLMINFVNKDLRVEKNQFVNN